MNPIRLRSESSDDLKNTEIATESSDKIFSMFIDYLDSDDFIGADRTRKYLQMGFTRARRYFNYKVGKKYGKEKTYQKLDRGTGDPEKAKAAAVFYKKWKDTENNKNYAQLKIKWKTDFG